MYQFEVTPPRMTRISQGGLQNGALTEQFSDLKSLDIGTKIGDPEYTPQVDFLGHDLL